MRKRIIQARDLIEKIERITRARMAQQEVVPIQSFRDFRNKVESKAVFVIEDDETMRSGLQKILEAEGFTVRTAGDATELSSLLEGTAPDLILMDVGLPWIDGFELAQLMRDHRDLKHIPLIFVSGKGDSSDLERAYELGAAAFLKKPFAVEELRQVLVKLF